MSTALVSPFFDYDLLSKNSILSQKTHFRSNNHNHVINNNNNSSSSSAVDRKAVGSPLGFSPNLRRSCSTSSAMTIGGVLGGKTSLTPPLAATTSSASSTSASALTFAGLMSDINAFQISINNNNNNNNNLNNNNNNNSSCLLGGTHRKLDRSMSEPVERGGGSSGGNQHRNSPSNSSRYKTELCRPFEESGTCKYGDKCQFAHGIHELRTLARHPKYKTELCRTFHTIGFCPYGPRCHFIHNADESRKAVPNGDGGIGAAVTTSPVHSRPKALSLGSFSLGSTGDSPPSSLCDSPTALNTFFDDAFPPNISSPGTPTSSSASAATATFVFGSQEISSKWHQQEMMTPIGKPIAVRHGSAGNVHSNMSSMFGRRHQFPVHAYNLRNASDSDLASGANNACLSPASPSGSLASDLDNLSLSGSPTCTSPLDVSRGLHLTLFGHSED